MRYKWWILIAAGVFGIGIIIGLVNPVGGAGILSENIAALGELSNFLLSLPLPVAAMVIFAKNAFALLLSFALSPLLCLIPLFTLVVNGWFLAFVSTTIAQQESLGFVLAGLVPHGIIELPAFILGEAAALSFGVMVIWALIKRERSQLVPGLKKNLRYLLVAVVLLIPAAIIETFVTPLLLT